MPALNIQCKEILTGLKRLEDIVLQPFTLRALDLPENALASRHRDQLVRLRKSLEQYINREGHLTYIGLVGHCLAGKSSLINSVLITWSTRQERRTGPHPTDTDITLLTHSDNANALLGVFGDESVPVRVQTIDDEFLRHVVLADTPGTGDPHLIADMAREFLPVCDLVLYVLAAANPIDETDLATLLELHKRLPFIPVLFVVTRADELRRNPQQPVSGANFNDAKASEFTAEASSRVSRLLESRQYDQSHFLLVDSLAQFGMPRLRAAILNRADPDNPSGQAGIHAHKVRFYSSASSELGTFFAHSLEARHSELRKVVSAAEKDIRLYNESAAVSHYNFSRSGHERYLALQNIAGEAREMPANFVEPPATVKEMDRVSEAMVRLDESCVRQAGKASVRLADHVRRNGLLQIKDEFDKIGRTLHERKTLEGLTANGHGLVNFPVKWSLDRVDLISPGMITTRLADVRGATRDCIEGAAATARDRVQEFSTTLNQRLVIGKAEAIVTAAQEQLACDLEKSFQSVQVYRSDVFSVEAKALYPGLGIGEEMARLEAEFTEKDRNGLVLKARRELFPLKTETLASATGKFGELADLLLASDIKSKTIQIEAPANLSEPIALAARKAASALEAELTSELERETSELIGRAQAKLSHVFGSVLESYEKALEGLGLRRLLTYSTTAAICIAIGVACTVGYAFFLRPAGQTTADIVWWSVLASLIANAVGLGVMWRRDDYHETKKRITDQHLAQLQRQTDTAISGFTASHNFNCLDEASLSARIGRTYSSISRIAAADAWQREADSQYEALRRLYLELIKLRSRYLVVVDGLVEECGVFFNDAERIRLVLKRISDEVKDRAIQPSFRLLSNTDKELRELKEAIEGIEFS